MAGLLDSIWGRDRSVNTAIKSKVLDQFIDIIEWADQPHDTIMWKYPDRGSLIQNGAQLTVREGQIAVFMNEGQFADVFTPGLYTLTTQNLPITSTLKNWKFDFNNPFKSDVYFFSTRLFSNVRWASTKPIIIPDPQLKRVRISAEGNFQFRISDPKLFFTEFAGSTSSVTLDEIDDTLVAALLGKFVKAVADINMGVEMLSSQYFEVGENVLPAMCEEMAEYGIGLHRFTIEGISLPPEVEAFLDKMSQVALADGNLNNYMKLQTADAIANAAEQDGGGGLMGIGAGVMMLNQAMGGMGSGGMNGLPTERADPETFKKSMHYFEEFKKVVNAPYFNTPIPVMSGNMGNELICALLRQYYEMSNGYAGAAVSGDWSGWMQAPEYQQALSQFSQLSQSAGQQMTGDDGSKLAQFSTALGERFTEFSQRISAEAQKKAQDQQKVQAAPKVTREEIIQSLKDLGDLKTSGVLTEAEFEQQKQLLMQKMSEMHSM